MANISKQTRQGFRSLLQNDILIARKDCVHPERMTDSYARYYCRDEGDKKIKRTKQFQFGGFDAKDVAVRIDERIDKRLAELGQKPMNRKDVKYSASLILTKPSQVPKEDEKKFFDSFEEFCWRYFGTDNMLVYAVHYHEATPHAQAYGMPVVDGKLNSKKWHTRKRYQELHDKLQRFMDSKMGYHVEIRLDNENPKKRANNVSVNTLKDKTNKEEIKTLKVANKEASAEALYWKRRTQKAEKMVRGLERLGLLNKVRSALLDSDELTEAELNAQYEIYHNQRIEAGKARQRNKGQSL